MIFVIDAAEKKDPSEWFGFWSMETGDWDYYDTKFSKAVKTPDSLIVIKNFDSMSGRVANKLMELFEGTMIVPPPLYLIWNRARHPWFYNCSKGVKFWLLGTSKTDVAWKDHLIGNSRIEHME